jgi:hypothetical protein
LEEAIEEMRKPVVVKVPVRNDGDEDENWRRRWAMGKRNEWTQINKNDENISFTDEYPKIHLKTNSIL